MTSMIAYNRFGLGMRANDPPLADPKAWLLAQITPAVALPLGVARAVANTGQQPTTLAMLAATRELRADKKAARLPVQSPMMESQMIGLTAGQAAGIRTIGEYYIGQMATRLDAALQTETPFAERLVHFWSNHFAISTDKAKVRALGGPYENEAIRPHVGSRFADMLLAVVQHPGMLLYLDNEQSIGPNSRVGQRRAARTDKKVGLNENLAREILELHTLGVRSVYTQTDVTEFARALTGWSVEADGRATLLRGQSGKNGFTYYDAFHEPGSRTILGRRYAEDGMGQAKAILRDIAAHPATATFIATKLARHFIADDPPATAVAILAKTFLQTGGDLPSVYRALIALPESWQTPLQKFKTPWEYAVSALRLSTTKTVDPRRGFAALRVLGQPSLAPGSPAGWPDVASRWVSSDGIAKRLSFAATLSARAPATFDARTLASNLFGTALSETTATELSRAESGAQALTLLLASPEFMRR
jgi:uncharacterized protein (DUF1800 family)